MKKPFINILSHSLAIFCLSLPLISHGEKNDVQQEIKINSSRQAADLKNKIFSYIDNVVIKQGSLIIKADLVQVITQSESDNKIYIAKGSPATFKQTLEDGSPIYLQANEIKYEPGKNTVIISGKAELRQEGSKVNSHTISYNFLTEQVTANSINNTNDRVQTVLQPKELDKENK